MDLALDELIDCVSDFVVVTQLNVELEKVLVGERWPAVTFEEFGRKGPQLDLNACSLEGFDHSCCRWLHNDRVTLWAGETVFSISVVGTDA